MVWILTEHHIIDYQYYMNAWQLKDIILYYKKKN